jgi:hypothetical protein
LIKPSDIFKADFQQHLIDFNNILVNKQLKPLYDKVLLNTGAIYVPNFTTLAGKLKQAWSKHSVD